MSKSDDPETAFGKVQTGNGKPETGKWRKMWKKWRKWIKMVKNEENKEKWKNGKNGKWEK